MINPQDESFFASKSMILLALSTGTIIVLILIYIAVKVFFHEDIAQVVLGAMGMETAKAGVGVARNTIVDGAQRSAFNDANKPPPSTGAF